MPGNILGAVSATETDPSWEPIRGNPYFGALQASEWEEVKALFREKSLSPGEIIFLEGERSQGIYFVKAGRIKVFKTSPDGKEQVLRIMGPGESFNDVPVFDQGPNPASTEAMEPSVVCLLRTQDIMELIRRYPALALGVTRVFATRLRQLTSLVEDLSFRHVTSRLAKILLMQVEEASKGSNLHLTQQDLASMVGTAREVVVRSLRSMESQGILRRERQRLVILDKEALWRLA
ncbi:MAG: Crp/Fnr family transcriptional regulator [Dehalococcoidia bacterium]|nr:Crp/Fnr family transcriptional regulator [Dehalococcoidia bacterium]